MVIPFCKSSNMCVCFLLDCSYRKVPARALYSCNYSGNGTAKAHNRCAGGATFKLASTLPHFLALLEAGITGIIPIVCCQQCALLKAVSNVTSIYASCSYSMLFSSGWEQNFENMTGFMPHSRGGKQRHVFFLPFPLYWFSISLYVSNSYMLQWSSY